MSSKPDDTNNAIHVQSVTKTYQIYNKPSDRLKQQLSFGNKKYYREFSALKDISFHIGRGETVGIIGRNGSGKSTLLQLICGTLRPTNGTVNVNGRIAALLELGAGFNMEFTGRENVYLYAAILGLSRKEVDERFESIAEFADIGDFIEQPVKTYSSGMYVRLAFATAINTDPDILIIDEALSVGDSAFQRKCFARIEQIQERGGTILFVSHSAANILQLCTKAILLDGGEKILEGRPKFIVNQYQRLMNLSGDNAKLAREEIKTIDPALALQEADEAPQSSKSETKKLQDAHVSLEAYDPNLVSQSRVEYETRGAKIKDLKIINSRHQQVNTLEMGREYTYTYKVHFSEDLEKVGFGMLIKTVNGVELSGGTTTRDKTLHLAKVKAGQIVEVSFKFICNLSPGTYFVNAGTSAEVDYERTFMHRILDGLIFHVAHETNMTSTGLVNLLVGPPKTSIIS